MDYIEIGYLKKPFGLDGKLKFEIQEKFYSDIENVEVVFLDRTDGFIPFFIESIDIGNPPTIKFEEVDNKEDASILSMSSLYLKKTDISLKEETDGTTDLSFLNSFTLFDKQESLGLILSVEEYPSQTMAILDISGSNILIPLHEKFIQSIDRDKRTIICDLPEGLVAAQLS